MKSDSSPPPEELAAYLAWHSIPGIGRNILVKIRDHFGSFLFAWHATTDTDSVWQQLLTKTQAYRTRHDPAVIAADRYGKNPHFITLIDPAYPAHLAASNPEPLLYYRGERLLLKEKIFLGVVGSRRFDHYNAEALTSLLSGLAGLPIVIVSGLALGIDGLAHQLALKHGLHTIAIPGSSVSDQEIYPRSHLHLSRSIVNSGGLLLSPFSVGTAIEPHLFPYRNAIIAGLCQTLLIVSAASKSGALITAQQAMDFGRDVLAVPGNIDQELSRGTNALIKQGALPVTSSDDIIHHLNLTRLPAHPQERRYDSELEHDVLTSLQYGPTSMEVLAHNLPQHTTSLLLSTLTMLELRNYVRKDQHNRWHLVV